MENNKMTHGLLIESFKQSIIELITQHNLDIQSKSLVLNQINIQVQQLSEQQTKLELEAYNDEQKRIENEKHQEIITENSN